MKRVLCGLMIVATIGCASSLRLLQQSHSSLALAQDLEAQLCWGTPDAKTPVPDRTVCTTPTAKAVGLTTARHREINANFVRAFELEKLVGTQVKIANKADVTSMVALVEAIENIVMLLDHTNTTVTQLDKQVTLSKQYLGGA